MTARIVIDDGTNPPVIGTVDRDNTFLATAFTLSNFDNAGVLAHRWLIVDRPATSTATLSSGTDPTTQLTPDIEGTYLVRLSSYLDAAATDLDDVDEQAIGVRFAGVADWRVPAAGETSQFNTTRGWAADVNEMLRDLRSGVVGASDLQNAYVLDRTISVTSLSGGPVLMTSVTDDERVLDLVGGASMGVSTPTLRIDVSAHPGGLAQEITNGANSSLFGATAMIADGTYFLTTTAGELRYSSTLASGLLQEMHRFDVDVTGQTGATDYYGIRLVVDEAARAATGTGYVWSAELTTGALLQLTNTGEMIQTVTRDGNSGTEDGLAINIDATGQTGTANLTGLGVTIDTTGRASSGSVLLFAIQDVATGAGFLLDNSGQLGLTLGGTAPLPALFQFGGTSGPFWPTVSTFAVSAGGSEAMRWDAGQSLLQDGVIAAPGIAFNSEAGLGLRRTGANAMAASAAGVDIATLSTIQAGFRDGVVGAPGVSFISSPTSGMWIDGSALRLSYAGIERLTVSGSGVQAQGTPFKAENGTAAAPTYAYQSDADLGHFRDDADVLGTTTGGQDYLQQVRSVTTPDATPLAIVTVPIAANSVNEIEATVIAREQSGADHARYYRSVRVVRVGGGPILGAAPSTDNQQETDGTWDCAFAINGNNVELQVTGAALTDIDWKARANYMHLT
jgi:hypothetical protein